VQNPRRYFVPCTRNKPCSCNEDRCNKKNGAELLEMFGIDSWSVADTINNRCPFLGTAVGGSFIESGFVDHAPVVYMYVTLSH